MAVRGAIGKSEVNRDEIHLRLFSLLLGLVGGDCGGRMYILCGIYDFFMARKLMF